MFAAGSHLETSVHSSNSPSQAADNLQSPYPVLPDIKSSSERSSARSLRAGQLYNKLYRYVVRGAMFVRCLYLILCSSR